MTLVDVAKATVTAIDQTFNNFASVPDRSNSGDGFLFSIPFERRVAWVQLASRSME
ncbi:MAG: hypothetical protein JST54_06260 [Deltaproteobacteria bacterium]|nr:hypothetical protein [Deltaproteobacteria bacterium]